ncbi:ATP-binding protein [Beggiatoa leptomitoformis]|uniref:AAA family ATPase n=1 Tax=Beggiatoa leptomitoformis TaxID=288004 RepID=A0A2N9YG47_9GAMM|nr:ATP-binding protein [Beggiatoa leptomitoformis]ALG68325.2 hypothetical protein AL038_12155 [Beggiatoa leptomitoformis]AUI69359.2 hypothetical protein BLE401_12110 [Beggiatoa leptomitoformis]
MTALLSGLLWGGVLGSIFWLQTDNLHSIWITAITVATAFTFMFTFVTKGTFAFMVVGAGISAFIGVFTGVFMSAFTGVFVGIFASISLGAGASIGIWIIGIFAGLLFPLVWIQTISILTGSIILIFGSWILFRIHIKDYPKWVVIFFVTTWLIGLQIVTFASFVHYPLAEATNFINILTISVGVGFLAGIEHCYKQSEFLTKLSIFFAILASFLWVITFTVATYQLKEKIIILVYYLTVTPFILSGLPFYPLVAFWHRYQTQLHIFKLSQLDNLLMFQWQSFAYPLPAFEQLFRHIIQLYDIETLLKFMANAQQKCLQQSTMARAMRKLINSPELAIAICAKITTKTNSDTILQLAFINPLGQAIAVLIPKKEDGETHHENSQPDKYTLFLAKPWQKNNFLSTFLKQPNDNKLVINSFEQVSKTSISHRLTYALEQLESCLHYEQAKEFKALLSALHHYANIKNIIEFDELRYHPQNSQTTTDWLNQGWQLFPIFQNTINELTPYRQFNNAKSRRDLLRHLIKKIKNRNTPRLSDIASYWADIGREIYEQWMEILETAIEEDRDYLSINVTIPEQTFLANGQQQTLQLRISNTSNVIAKRLILNILTCSDGIHCTTEHQTFPLILERQATQTLTFTFICHQSGDYELQGEVIAEALDNTLYRIRFNTRLHVGVFGKPYIRPTHALYIIGSSIGSSERFIGRKKLIQTLKEAWQQTDDKPAILLLGQRRIGKTSLLNQLERMSLEECQLLPIKIDAQAWQTEREFLMAVIDRLAKKLKIPCITLPDNDYRATFSYFITHTIHIPLAHQRILLMVDETEDLFSAQKYYGSLVGYLRSMMQGHEYPLLLLFSGAHKLKAIAKQKDSVFFNTTQEFTISYMNSHETSELLTKNAQNYLEFSQLSLEVAYQLTHGQPLLLQMLGNQIIEQFNDCLESNQTRSIYVDYNDIQQAADKVANAKENKAFTEHWDKISLVTQSVLAVFAVESDEENHPFLDIEVLDRAIKAHKLSLQRHELADILDDLTNEEILQRTELTYGFVVPLYRRWIKWRHPPQQVRERYPQ